MRKISMKRKSRTPNSEISEVQEDDQSNDENQEQEQDSMTETPNKRKSKRASKAGSEENGTDKKIKKSKITTEEEVEDEEQYEVEKVLDAKMVRGVRHFLIRWKGYEEDSDTWEPENTLSCQELIDEYLNSKNTSSQANKRSKKKGEKNRRPPLGSNEDGGPPPDGVYEVDRIIEVHHKRNGQREFLVHWKGYSQSDNSWEPEEHMNCPDLIERFMAKVARAKEQDTRELRVRRQPTERFTLQMEQAGRKLSRRNLGRQRVRYHDSE